MVTFAANVIVFKTNSRPYKCAPAPNVAVPRAIKFPEIEEFAPRLMSPAMVPATQ